MKTFVDCNMVSIMLISIGLNLGLSGYAIYKARANNTIYTIGVNRLTDSFVKGLNNTALSKEQQNAQLVGFCQGLDASLKEFKINGKVLMMEEAVLSGGIDITDQVVARIKKEMKK